jgi:hypothetical protein
MLGLLVFLAAVTDVLKSNDHCKVFLSPIVSPGRFAVGSQWACHWTEVPNVYSVSGGAPASASLAQVLLRVANIQAEILQALLQKVGALVLENNCLWLQFAWRAVA